MRLMLSDTYVCSNSTLPNQRH
jgi:hypothetical protein